MFFIIPQVSLIHAERVFIPENQICVYLRHQREYIFLDEGIRINLSDGFCEL